MERSHQIFIIKIKETAFLKQESILMNNPNDKKKKSLISWFVDKFNDETEDKFFLEQEEKFRVKWRTWALEMGYSPIAGISEIVKEKMKGSPFLQYDKPLFDLHMTRDLENMTITSYHFERRFNSFFTDQTNTYDALVGYVALPLGDGAFVIDKDQEGTIIIGNDTMKIRSNDGEHIFTLSGSPDHFMERIMKPVFTEWVKDLTEVKVSYTNGDLFFIRPAPSWLTLRGVYLDQNDSVYDIGRFRRWDKHLERWILALSRLVDEGKGDMR